MTNRIIVALLIIVGVVHLLPVAGITGAERLAAMYDLPLDEPNLIILMRHRALLFGLLGALMLYAAYQPALRPLAFVAGLVSVGSFLWLAWSAQQYNDALQRVVWMDLLALLCLLIAVTLHILTPRVTAAT